MTKNMIALHAIVKKESPSHIHVNTLESAYGVMLACLLLRIKNTKLSLTIHDIQSMARLSPLSIQLNKLVKRCDSIFLLGEYLKFNNPSLNRKVIHINNRAERKSKTIIEKFPKKTFLFIGRIDFKEKDYASVFHAFRKVADTLLAKKFSLVFISKARSEKLIYLLKK